MMPRMAGPQLHGGRIRGQIVLETRSSCWQAPTSRLAVDSFGVCGLYKCPKAYLNKAVTYVLCGGAAQRHTEKVAFLAVTFCNDLGKGVRAHGHQIYKAAC